MAHLTLGSSPISEDCAQISTNDYAGYEDRARKECQVFIVQLMRHYRAEHSGQEIPCRLVIGYNPHDFGTYLDVRAMFEEDTHSEEAAYWLEANTPEFWDAEARVALGLPPSEDA